jgi:SAM-dependent methyltransferase
MDRPRENSPEVIACRASSVCGQAAAYAAERPGYPDAAIRWALEPVAARTPLRVLDLAAGTGKLTQGLLRTGAQVVAVEPDRAMLAELHRLLPDVRALAGTAERIPLDDGSVDAVVVGQAIHWFDPERAFPEIARVLAPGGVLAGLWNHEDDRVPWVRGLQEVSQTGVSFSRWQDRPRLEPSPYFPALEHEDFPNVQRRTAESMAGTVGTHSHALVLPDEERVELIGRVRRYLSETPETANGEFDLPLVTQAVRGVRA